jgi:ribosomal protein L11 methyltransferase
VWISAAVIVDAQHADSLADALMGFGALSVSVEDAQAGTDEETPQFGEPGSPTTPLWEQSRVLALFEPGDDLANRIALACQEIGLVETPEISLEDVAEQNWVQLTQSQFDPIQITDKLWIVPSWHMDSFAEGHADEEGKIVLQLDPGMAFGTGSHPTTFLCLQWLSETLQGGETVLDYGCGSGILAIAAARLGAGPVLGIDIDEKALEAAHYNAEHNGVALAIRHSREELNEQFDIVVANILTNPLCVLAPLLSGRIAPGGKIALSGVLEAQADQVIAAYAPYIALEIGATHEGWCRLQGVR